MHKFTTVKQQQPNSLENRLSKQIISDISRRLINLNRDAYFHVCVCVIHFADDWNAVDFLAHLAN